MKATDNLNNSDQALGNENMTMNEDLIDPLCQS